MFYLLTYSTVVNIAYCLSVFSASWLLFVSRCTLPLAMLAS